MNTNIEKHCVAKQSRDGTKLIRQVNFRYPIAQLDDHSVVVTIPTGGRPLVFLAEEAVEELKLNEAEYEAALEAASEAALMSVIIRK